MFNVFGDSFSSDFVIKFWSKDFKHGHVSLEDGPRNDRPVSAVTEDTVDLVKKIMLADQRIKQWEIAKDVGIIKECVHVIIHGHLGLSEVSARWVPRMLTPFFKQRRVECCEAFLDLVKDREEETVSRIVTCDETWIRQWEPESKQESIRWKFKGRSHRTSLRCFYEQASLWQQFFGM